MSELEFSEAQQEHIQRIVNSAVAEQVRVLPAERAKISRETIEMISADVEVLARKVARAEVASLAGLVLSRTSEEHFTRSSERNTAEDVVSDRLASIFGEALADFSGHTGGGNEPE